MPGLDQQRTGVLEEPVSSPVARSGIATLKKMLVGSDRLSTDPVRNSPQEVQRRPAAADDSRHDGRAFARAQPKKSVAVVTCYDAADQAKANRVIKKVKLDQADARSLVVIDRRSDNKLTGSKAWTRSSRPPDGAGRDRQQSVGRPRDRRGDLAVVAARPRLGQSLGGTRGVVRGQTMTALSGRRPGSAPPSPFVVRETVEVGKEKTGSSEDVAGAHHDCHIWAAAPAATSAWESRHYSLTRNRRHREGALTTHRGRPPNCDGSLQATADRASTGRPRLPAPRGNPR